MPVLQYSVRFVGQVRSPQPVYSTFEHVPFVWRYDEMFIKREEIYVYWLEITTLL